MSEIAGVIISGLFSLAGIFITAFITKSNIMHELDKRMSLSEQKLEEYGNDIKAHNHYAKLFAETVPVVQEQIKEHERRLSALERGNKAA